MRLREKQERFFRQQQEALEQASGRRIAKRTPRESILSRWDRTLRRWLSRAGKASEKQVRLFNERYRAKHGLGGPVYRKAQNEMALMESMANSRGSLRLHDLIGARQPILNRNEVRLRQTERLDETYVRGRLARALGVSAKEVPGHLIELKTAQLLIRRTAGELKGKP